MFSFCYLLVDSRYDIEDIDMLYDIPYETSKTFMCTNNIPV